MKLALYILAFTFILLRPYVIDGSGFWYYGDDQDYFAHASSIVFGQFPSYKKEYLVIDQQYPQSSIGSSLLAVPFVLFFSVIDRVNGSNIVVYRTPSNIPGSWTEFGFIFSSCLYFSLGCFLLYRGLLYVIAQRFALLSVFLTVLAQGLPLFSFRRPIFSHTAEFFLQSLFIFLILRNSVSTKKFPSSVGQYLVLGVLAALTFLTRYNNIVFALLAPIAVLHSAGLSCRSKDIWRSIIILGVFSFLVGIFKIYPEAYNHKHVYQWAKDYLFITPGILDFLKRVIHVFIGLDWGLIYTAPYIWLGFIVFIFYKHPVFKYMFWFLTALSVNFYVMLIWGSQGGWYGYRYFIASAVPIFVLPVALLIKNTEEGFKRKLTMAWILIAVPSLLSMICFEGNNTNLDLYTAVQDFGRSDITNNLYQFHVWQTVLFKPQEFFSIICRGGIDYFHYIVVHGFQMMGLLSNIYFKFYTTFDSTVLIKVLLIYAIPFVVVGVFKRTMKDCLIDKE